MSEVDFSTLTQQEIIDAVIAHARDFEFMSGVERSAQRIKATAEVFTPTKLVREILAELPIKQFSDPSSTVLDPCCGDGQFLSEVLIKKLENGSTFEAALRTIFGVEIMFDNVEVCRNRLLCGQESLRYIVTHNIVAGDGLTFNYDQFGNQPVKSS